MTDPLARKPFAITLLQNGELPKFVGFVPYGDYFQSRNVLIEGGDDLHPSFTFDRAEGEGHVKRLNGYSDIRAELVSISELDPRQLAKWHDDRQAELTGRRRPRAVDRRYDPRLIARREAETYFQSSVQQEDEGE